MTEYIAEWKSLYKTAGVAAILLLGYSLATMAVLLAIGGAPPTALEGFYLLQENRLAGMLRLDVLLFFCMPLYYLLYLGFFAALHKAHLAPVAVAALLGCAGVTLVLATPSAFSFLALSDRYAAAAGEAQKTLFLAAGEAVLAADMWHASGAFTGGLLGQVGMLLASLLMLRDPAFGRATAWAGVVTHGLDLLHILVGMLASAAGAALMFVAGPLYLVWFPLLARDFFRLGKG